jgi:hypothetical protein
VFLKSGSMIRRLASLHWLQRGEVRQLHRYYQDAMTSCRPSRRTSFPSLGDTSVSLALFAPVRTSGPPGPGVGNPVSPAGKLPRKQQDLPSSWGTSMIRSPCSKPTPAGLLAPDHKVQQRGPWSSQGKGSRNGVFRRSIAWLSDSLSTLRRAGYPVTTQDSLPVAGQALLDGLLTRKVPLKGFRVVDYTSSPFPKLAWRNGCNRLRDRNYESRSGRDSDERFAYVRRWPQYCSQTPPNSTNRSELLVGLIGRRWHGSAKPFSRS